MIWTTDYTFSNLWSVVKTKKLPNRPIALNCLTPTLSPWYLYMDNAVTSLVSWRLNTSGSNTNSCSICKGENWEWHLRCASSVSSGSKSNHTKDCTLQHACLSSSPPVSSIDGEKDKTNATREPMKRFVFSVGECTLARPSKSPPTK